MSKIKVAINGFGRIGRNVFKIALERNDIEIVGINDITDTRTLAHLLKYDSTQGKYPGVSCDDENIIVNGVKVKVTAERNPADIPWSKTPDVVVESTGIFTSKERRLWRSPEERSKESPSYGSFQGCHRRNDSPWSQ
jgi:glyceraldehyde 3-phosphate dehydrogenase